MLIEVSGVDVVPRSEYTFAIHTSISAIAIC